MGLLYITQVAWEHRCSERSLDADLPHSLEQGMSEQKTRKMGGGASSLSLKKPASCEGVTRGLEGPGAWLGQF